MGTSPAAGAPDCDASELASSLGPLAGETFHNGKVILHAGDCLAVLAQLPENSVDAVVTDPPYHLASIVKRFGGANAAPAQHGADGAFARSARGFMGKQWDGGEIAHRPETWAAVLRVLKPGGHCVAFHASKNWAFQAVAMAQAGFELRDTVIDLFDPAPVAAEFVASLSPAQAEAFAHVLAADDRLADLFWIYGSGFPKGVDVSKAIDKRMGETRPLIRERYEARRIKPGATVLAEGAYGKQEATFKAVDTAAVSEMARAFDGWNVALKPAFEPIVLARKPLAEKSVAEQVLATGTGAINVGGCRVGDDGGTVKSGSGEKCLTTSVGGYLDAVAVAGVAVPGLGRWPANVTHDGSAAVEAGFPESDGSGPARILKRGQRPEDDGWGMADQPGALRDSGAGSASRFFYSSKADAEDRIGSKHPTVKPVALMRWLLRMVTPPGGVVLDPFAGTGTTGEAALLEGFNAILIEREAEYRADIARRMEAVFASPSARMKAKAARGGASPPMPLFAEPAEGGGGATDLRNLRGSATCGGGQPLQPASQAAQRNPLRPHRTIGPIGLKR